MKKKVSFLGDCLVKKAGGYGISGWGMELMKLLVAARRAGYELATELADVEYEKYKEIVEAQIPEYSEYLLDWAKPEYDDIMFVSAYDPSLNPLVERCINRYWWLAIDDYSLTEPRLDLLNKAPLWLITDTRHTYDSCVASGVLKEKIFCAQPLVDTEIFKPMENKSELREKYGLPQDCFLFVETSGIDDFRKGTYELIQAFKQGFGFTEGVKLVLKTNEFYGKEPYPWVTELEDDERFILLKDWFTQTEMAELLNACDCYVHPFRLGATENTVLEAMACGKVVIVTHFAGVSDYCNETNTVGVPHNISPVWRPNDSPAVLPERDIIADIVIDALADRLRDVVGNSDNYSHLGEKALETARTMDIMKTWEIVEGILQQTYGRRPLVALSSSRIIASLRGSPQQPTRWNKLEKHYSELLKYQEQGGTGADAQGGCEEAVQWALEHSPNMVRKVLDVGCGAGYAAARFQYLGIEVEAITLSEVDLMEAEKLGVFAKRMDFNFLEYPDKSFDMVFAREVLEHSPMPPLTLLEWKRALDDDGSLFISVPTFETHGSLMMHYFCLNEEQWRHIFDICGFTVEAFEEKGYHMLFLLRKC